MLQIQLLRENPQEVIDRLKIKNFDATELVAEIRELDSENRNLKKKIDDNLMAQNQGAKQIGQLFKEGKRDEAEAIKAEMANLKESERTDRAKLQEQEELLQSKMVLLPNLPNAAVAPGKGADHLLLLCQAPSEGEYLLEGRADYRYCAGLCRVARTLALRFNHCHWSVAGQQKGVAGTVLVLDGYPAHPRRGTARHHEDGEGRGRDG